MIRLQTLGRARSSRDGSAIATGCALVVNLSLPLLGAATVGGWWWALGAALTIVTALRLVHKGRKPGGGEWLLNCGIGVVVTLAGFAAIAAFMAGWFWIYR